MKEIKLDIIYKKILYVISWIAFILFGFGIFWLIAIGLGTYGRNTGYNVKKKKWVLNKTWQKFVYFYGLTFIGLMIIVNLLALIFNL